PEMTAHFGRPAPSLAEQVAGARAYNRWLSDFCGEFPRRMLGVMVAPMLLIDVDAAVEEVRWGKEHGLDGGVFLPFMTEESPGYNNPVYDPFWATCEELGVPVNNHGAPFPRAHRMGLPSVAALFSMESGTFSHRALWYSIFGGVFERFPGLTM